MYLLLIGNMESGTNQGRASLIGQKGAGGGLQSKSTHTAADAVDS